MFIRSRESAPRHSAGVRVTSLSRGRRALVVAAVAATTLTTIGASSAYASDADRRGGHGHSNPAGDPDLGPNVKIFDPSMSVADIKKTVDAIAAEQVNSEMGTGRYALLFKPGTYGTPENPLVFEVGYYTEVAGLGKNPSDVVINGSINVYDRCLENGQTSNCLALVNFWRSMSNLTINVKGGLTHVVGEAADRPSWCTDTEFWAVSQAAPLRRVNINGPLSFMDYCPSSGPHYASGGFMADSKVSSTAVNGTQQQFIVRNSEIGGWSNGVWNQVFAGVIGAPAQDFPAGRFTTLATNPTSREKPYPYIDATGKWNLFVPAAAANSTGTTWANGDTLGRSIPWSDVYVAKPSDSELRINVALATGKNLVFSPGIYDIDHSLVVARPDTVVLGLGIATLNAVNGAVPIRVADVKGVDIAGIMLDAGTTNSRALMIVGTGLTQHLPARARRHFSDPADPTALQDVFFRVGGHSAGKASAALVVNSDNVILDELWAWRADHGEGAGWTSNTSRNGVIVNGDNVTATGLFVEHFQEYNVIWNGENGKTIFFQNELPYDPPNQAAWQHDGILGWAAYKVADTVKTHELWGGGSYIFTNVDPTIHATQGFEVPVTPGVKMHDLLTVQLSAGTIDHVINGVGDPVTVDAIGVPSFVTEYPVAP